MKNIFFKMMNVAVLTVFVLQTVVMSPGYAQVVPLTQSAVQVGLAESFAPVMIRGMRLNPDNGLNMSFIVDAGNASSYDPASAVDAGGFLQKESEKLIKYFLAALTIPEKDLWVNLSPYEKDRIVPSSLGQTDMGRDMLALDYMLKQMTSALLNPEDKTGEIFWDKIHTKVYEKYGQTDLPVESLNKVWIMPDTVEIFAQGDTVLITKSRMKVMLEGDYLATDLYHSKMDSVGEKTPDAVVTEDVKDIMRDVIIPVLEEEVNQGEHFAQLRQIFNSLILAKWFKDNLKTSVINRVYSDREKISGVDHGDTNAINSIYEQYVDAFRAGTQGLIKEDYDPQTQSMKARKYVTGGEKFDDINYAELDDTEQAYRNFAELVNGRAVYAADADLAPESNPAMMAGKKKIKNTSRIRWMWRGIVRGSKWTFGVLTTLIVIGLLYWKIFVKPYISYQPFASESWSEEGDKYGHSKGSTLNKAFSRVDSVPHVVERLKLIQRENLAYEELLDATSSVVGLGTLGELKRDDFDVVENFLRDPSLAGDDASFSIKYVINDFKKEILRWLVVSQYHRSIKNDAEMLERFNNLMSDFQEYQEEGQTSPDFEKYFPNANQNEVLGEMLRFKAKQLFFEKILRSEEEVDMSPSLAVVIEFISTWGTPYDLEKSLERIKKSEESSVVEIPLSSLNQIVNYRSIQPEILEFVKESATYHGVSPRLVFLKIFYRYKSSYALRRMMLIAVARDIISKETDLVLADYLPSRVLTFTPFESETMRYLGGAVWEGHAKSGVGSQRDSWVRRYNSLDRFMDTDDMSDKAVSRALWIPRNGVEALAVYWKGLIEDSRQAYALAMEGKPFSTVRYKDTEARRYVGFGAYGIVDDDSTGDVERVEYYKYGTPPTVFDEMGESWLATIHHPVELEYQFFEGYRLNMGAYTDIRSPALGLHEGVAMAGLFGVPNQTAVFTEIFKEEDLLILKDVLERSEDEYIRGAAIASLERIAAESNNPLSNKAQEILNESEDDKASKNNQAMMAKGKKQKTRPTAKTRQASPFISRRDFLTAMALAVGAGLLYIVDPFGWFKKKLSYASSETALFGKRSPVRPGNVIGVGKGHAVGQAINTYVNVFNDPRSTSEAKLRAIDDLLESNENQFLGVVYAEADYLERVINEARANPDIKEVVIVDGERSDAMNHNTYVQRVKYVHNLNMQVANKNKSSVVTALREGAIATLILKGEIKQNDDFVRIVPADPKEIKEEGDKLMLAGASINDPRMQELIRLRNQGHKDKILSVVNDQSLVIYTAGASHAPRLIISGVRMDLILFVQTSKELSSVYNGIQSQFYAKMQQLEQDFLPKAKNIGLISNHQEAEKFIRNLLEYYRLLKLSVRINQALPNSIPSPGMTSEQTDQIFSKNLNEYPNYIPMIKESLERNFGAINVDISEVNGDFAMMDQKQDTTTGGIDFDSSDMDMKNAGRGLDIEIKDGLGNIDPAMLQGIAPVNIRLTPITSIGVLFGKAENGTDAPDSAHNQTDLSKMILKNEELLV